MATLDDSQLGASADGHVVNVLERLAVAPEGQLSGVQLQHDIRGLTYHRLDDMVERGWLRTWHELAQVKVKPKTQTWVHLQRWPTSGERLGDIQRQILEVLQKRQEIDIDTLREQVPNARPSLRAMMRRGMVSLEEREVIRDPFADAPPRPVVRHPLTMSQQAAVDAILDGPAPGTPKGYRGFLLHGVTGSGKTEVYVNVIRTLRGQGLNALILLPEIALTPQFCGVFRGHFGDDVAVLHSGLTPGERYDAWRRLRRGEVGIAIGARSALFAPITQLGVIIVDEEHDSSFKQGESPRYHARDMAIMRAHISRCRLILGSATPSLESFFLTRQGRLHYLAMAQRVGGRALPEVEIVNMASADAKPRRPVHGEPLDDETLLKQTLSPQLIQGMKETLARHEQVILLLNRRGYAPFIQCYGCGHALYCPQCSVSLTFHQSTQALHCHYCDFTTELPDQCPKCQSDALGLLGVGTQRLTEMLRSCFPDRRIERLDRDSGSGKGLQRLLEAFRGGDIDVLVGTQMVAKGHDIHNVTLVGVIMADLSLKFPDFRSAERTFQLLTQVAGRAGRGTRAGRVLIQTLSPDHYVLLAAQQHSFEQFLADEIGIREDLRYPPFSFLIGLRFEHRDVAMAGRCADLFATIARAGVPVDEGGAPRVEILGPALAPLGRLRGRARVQVLLKSKHRRALRVVVDGALKHMEPALKREYRKVRVAVDVDPVSML